MAFNFWPFRRRQKRPQPSQVSEESAVTQAAIPETPPAEMEAFTREYLADMMEMGIPPLLGEGLGIVQMMQAIPETARLVETVRRRGEAIGRWAGFRTVVQPAFVESLPSLVSVPMSGSEGSPGGEVQRFIDEFDVEDVQTDIFPPLGSIFDQFASVYGLANGWESFVPAQRTESVSTSAVQEKPATSRVTESASPTSMVQRVAEENDTGIVFPSTSIPQSSPAPQSLFQAIPNPAVSQTPLPATSVENRAGQVSGAFASIPPHFADLSFSLPETKAFLDELTSRVTPAFMGFSEPITPQPLVMHSATAPFIARESRLSDPVTRTVFTPSARVAPERALIPSPQHKDTEQPETNPGAQPSRVQSIPGTSPAIQRSFSLEDLPLRGISQAAQGLGNSWGGILDGVANRLTGAQQMLSGAGQDPRGMLSSLGSSAPESMQRGIRQALGGEEDLLHRNRMQNTPGLSSNLAGQIPSVGNIENLPSLVGLSSLSGMAGNVLQNLTTGGGFGEILGSLGGMAENLPEIGSMGGQITQLSGELSEMTPGGIIPEMPALSGLGESITNIGQALPGGIVPEMPLTTSIGEMLGGMRQGMDAENAAISNMGQGESTSAQQGASTVPQMPNLDRLVDRVYQQLQRRLQVERERSRGLA